MDERSGFGLLRELNRAAALLCWWAAVAPAQTPSPVVLEANVTGFSSERGIVALSTGSSAGVTVGDHFWVFRDGIYASGEILTTSDNGSTGTVESALDIPAGRRATVLRSSAFTTYRESLPPEVTIRGHLTRVSPGRRNAWLDIGAHAGLKPGDTLLIRRVLSPHVEMPLARGRLEIVREDTALAALEPIVSNTLPQPDDVAELWPSPWDRSMGGVESIVLAVTGPDEEERLTLTLVGTAEDGFEAGRLVDLYHGRDYAGHAIIDRVGDPNSVAKTVRAGQRLAPQVGDRARVRPPPGPKPKPLVAAVFGITPSPEGDYAQLAAGDTDGVRRDEKFIIRHHDPTDATIRRDVAELTILKVNDDHSTAVVRQLTRDEKVVQWDSAERLDPPMPDWRAIGIVQSVNPDSRSAVIALEQRSTATVGRMVRWIPEAPTAEQPARCAGAAVVINRSSDEAIIFVPPGWGDVDDLINARIELADPPGPTSRPAR